MSMDIRHEQRRPRSGSGAAARLRGVGQRALSLRARRGDGAGERLAEGLGWFSLGLGLAELLAPAGVARLVGVRDDADNRAVLRACGVREIATGVGILTEEQPASLLWGRVAGDVMDLLLLGTALGSENTERDRTAMGVVAVAGVALLDVLAAQQLTQQAIPVAGEGRLARLARGAERDGRTDGARTGEGTPRALRENRGIHVKRVVTVNRTPDEVYRFWHDFQNLPSFMSHLESVQVTGPRRSTWKARAPAGMRVTWDAETTEDVPGQRIAWRSLPGADVDNTGSVRFVAAPGGRGTEVHVELDYRPPGGAFGALVAKLFGEAPEQQIAGDLRRFKQVMETGEVVHSDASIHRGMHAAHPPEGQARA